MSFREDDIDEDVVVANGVQSGQGDLQRRKHPPALLRHYHLYNCDVIISAQNWRRYKSSPIKLELLHTRFTTTNNDL